MNQDRRKNGWILLSSILQIMLSIIVLSAGVALAVTGFLYKSKLATIEELQFFINQKGIIKAQQLISGSNALMLKQFLYLSLGIILAVVGIIVLILAISSLVSVQKRSVVRHKVRLMIFALIPLIVAGCATTYLIFEMDVLPKLVKYIVYGIIGGFGASALFMILGLMFGRSEKFMSNDNNKYAFDNSSLRNARADVNNNVRNVQTNMGQDNNLYMPNNEVYNQQQANPQNGMVQPNRQTPNMQRAQRVATGQPIRSTSAIARPVQGMGAQQANQASTRPMNRMQGQQPARSMQQRPIRPMPQGASVRPNNMQPQRTRQVLGGEICPVCGATVPPQEKFCVRCGTRVSK